MAIKKIENIFSDLELESINKAINDHKNKNENIKNDSVLGRTYFDFVIPKDIEEKVNKICSEVLNTDLTFSYTAYADYNNLHGNPSIPPHFDGDDHLVVFDYQLESNTSWDLGVDFKSYKMKDNSALIFNPNKNIHWRPHKKFNDGEYVKMLFLRFHDKNNKVDYSHLKKYKQDHAIFQPVAKFRNSLTQS